MAERERCVFCRREKANGADWGRNDELNDEQAAAAGLDNLCWEPEDESCIALLAESDRPTNLEAALEALEHLDHPHSKPQGEGEPPEKIGCGECPRGAMVLSPERVYECNVCPARMSLETYQRSRQPQDQEGRAGRAYRELDQAVKRWENATTSRLKLLAGAARQPESSDCLLKADRALFEARQSIARSALQDSGGQG